MVEIGIWTGELRDPNGGEAGLGRMASPDGNGNSDGGDDDNGDINSGNKGMH